MHSPSSNGRVPAGHRQRRARLDARPRSPGAGRLQGGGSKRSAAIFDDLLIDSSADGFVYAVELNTGKPV